MKQFANITRVVTRHLQRTQISSSLVCNNSSNLFKCRKQRSQTTKVLVIYDVCHLTAQAFVAEKTCAIFPGIAFSTKIID